LKRRDTCKQETSTATKGSSKEKEEKEGTFKPSTYLKNLQSGWLSKKEERFRE
jgi:hypothetical protein